MGAKRMVRQKKAVIMDQDGVRRALTRIAHEIVERNRGVRDLAIIGVRHRGVYLGQRLAQKIAEIEGQAVPFGILDISNYRDDRKIRPREKVQNTEIEFPVDGKIIVLVDDVLYTGRTVRAALDAIIDRGRPASVQLAVLIDRGHRELPVRADYVGKNVPTSHREIISTHLAEADGTDCVIIETEDDQ